jgi:hypothetical protein
MRQTCGREQSRGKSWPPEGGEGVPHIQFSELCSGYGDPLYLLPRTERRRLATYSYFWTVLYPAGL